MAKASWYGVRCLLRWEQAAGRPYEESITIWRADSFDEAIVKAERAARESAALLGGEYLGLAQAFFIGDDESITEGAEVFSLVRDNELEPEEYLTAFFATGDERQGDAKRIS
ncbi:hypothetical protein SMC26_32045 [Actinomadura fulvescens]|uniref:DUF4288 domain-containing protein n=1 Tax=Actinomadura fulvescens TaxID=46160 RepID=A0ABN3PWV3_9ACTN